MNKEWFGKKKKNDLGISPDGPEVKTTPANAEDTDLIPGPRVSHMPRGH